jgi:hypothetical protein
MIITEQDRHACHEMAEALVRHNADPEIDPQEWMIGHFMQLARESMFYFRWAAISTIANILLVSWMVLS